MNPEGHPMATPTPEARAQITEAQRVALILMARSHGIPVRTIADAMGLSTQRVYQIIKDHS